MGDVKQHCATNQLQSINLHTFSIPSKMGIIIATMGVLFKKAATNATRDVGMGCAKTQCVEKQCIVMNCAYTIHAAVHDTHNVPGTNMRSSAQKSVSDVPMTCVMRRSRPPVWAIPSATAYNAMTVSTPLLEKPTQPSCKVMILCFRVGVYAWVFSGGTEGWWESRHHYNHATTIMPPHATTNNLTPHLQAM